MTKYATLPLVTFLICATLQSTVICAETSRSSGSMTKLQKLQGQVTNLAAELKSLQDEIKQLKKKQQVSKRAPSIFLNAQPTIEVDPKI